MHTANLLKNRFSKLVYKMGTIPALPTLFPSNSLSEVTTGYTKIFTFQPIGLLEEKNQEFEKNISLEPLIIPDRALTDCMHVTSDPSFHLFPNYRLVKKQNFQNHYKPAFVTPFVLKNKDREDPNKYRSKSIVRVRSNGFKILTKQIIVFGKKEAP